MERKPPWERTEFDREAIRKSLLRFQPPMQELLRQETDDADELLRRLLADCQRDWEEFRLKAIASGNLKLARQYNDAICCALRKVQEIGRRTCTALKRS